MSVFLFSRLFIKLKWILFYNRVAYYYTRIFLIFLSGCTGTLYSHLFLISQTIPVRWALHTGHGWINKDKIINNILLWTPTHGHTRVGKKLHSPARCGLWMPSRWLIKSDGRQGRIERVSQGNRDCRQILMMMMMMMIGYSIFFLIRVSMLQIFLIDNTK